MAHRIAALILFIAASMINASATHWLGSEIRYFHNTGTTYTIVVSLYGDPGSPADRPEIQLDLGDGTLSTVSRFEVLDYSSEVACGMVRLSTYRLIHTYEGPGTFVIRFEDANRSSGVLNIPNSITQAACVTALLLIDPELGPNTSIRFDTLQTSTYRNGNTLIHDPGPFDGDGDSLSFEMIVPSGLGCGPIAGYGFPEGVNFAIVEQGTGRFLWDYPAITGGFNVTIRGSEWRDGTLIGQVTRDMTICVGAFQVGVDEIGSGDLFYIRPHPDGDTYWVRNPYNDALDVDVIAPSGALIGRSTIPNGEHVLDLAGIAQGLCFVRVVGPHGRTQTTKVTTF